MIVAMRRLLMVAAACLLGGATAAWACPVDGRVVCTGTDVGVPNVTVTLTAEVAGVPGGSGLTGETGAFEVHLWQNYGYVATLDLGGGLVVTMPGLVFCPDWPTLLPPWEVDAPFCGTPPPPPVTSADCSPGYYKNHPEAWCTQCGYDVQGCAYMIGELSAKGTSGAVRRDSAKALIDACFGTAALSPCVDD